VLKIVDGIPYVGQATDHFRVRAIELGNGQIEATAVRVIAWHEADWSPEYLADVQEAIERARMERTKEEQEQLSRLRAARRAKTRVRRLCKVMGADTLVTLTYRGSQPDLAVCKAHVKEFNRRMLRVLPSFCFVACFELQQRGTWHAHLATRNIPAVLPPAAGGGDWRSFNVIRAVWRSVTGELQGNIDVARRKRHSDKSAAQVASYISKYVGKSFEDQAAGSGTNRYAVYGEVQVPDAVDLGTVNGLHQAIELTYGLLGQSQAVSTARLDNWRDWFFVAGEIRQKKRPLGAVAEESAVFDLSTHRIK
jgi:hypothetical protein